MDLDKLVGKKITRVREFGGADSIVFDFEGGGKFMVSVGHGTIGEPTLVYKNLDEVKKDDISMGGSPVIVPPRGR